MIELSYEEAEKMLLDRIHEYPEIEKLIQQDAFKASIAQILKIEGLDSELEPLIENHIKLVLGFFMPQSDLPESLSEDVEIPLDKATAIASLAEILIFGPVQNELTAFQYLWNQELEKNKNLSETVPLKKTEPVTHPSLPEAPKDLKEKLELRPEGVPTQMKPTPIADGTEATGPKPLTREEVLQALSPKRTMAGDIESIKQKSDEEVRGYEAYQDLKKTP